MRFVDCMRRAVRLRGKFHATAVAALITLAAGCDDAARTDAPSPAGAEPAPQGSHHEPGDGIAVGSKFGFIVREASGYSRRVAPGSSQYFRNSDARVLTFALPWSSSTMLVEGLPLLGGPVAAGDSFVW